MKVGGFFYLEKNIYYCSSFYYIFIVGEIGNCFVFIG